MATIAKTPGIAYRVIAEYVPGPSLVRLKRRPDEIVFFAGQHREGERLMSGWKPRRASSSFSIALA
jgi:hypothetical protein